jgi:hypothetical protein
VKPFQQVYLTPTGFFRKCKIFLTTTLLKISPFLLHLNGDIPSRGPGNPRRLTRHGNADFRAGVLVSSALCGSLAFSALFISTLGEFGLGELTTLESLTTRTQISRSLARSEVEVLTRRAPRDSSEARGSVATRGGVAPGAKKATLNGSHVRIPLGSLRRCYPWAIWCLCEPFRLTCLDCED